MTQAVQKLVLDFEALPEAERHQLLAELLRRAAAEPRDLPNDADLVGAADEIFQDLDRREQER
jgi:hypothetical protein